MINNDLQKIFELNEFQKKKIKRNLSYDFIKELDKKTDSKEFFFKIFSKKIEVVSKVFDSQGIMFYGINFEFYDENNSFEEVYKEIEEFLNYIGYNIELVEFCYMSIEIKGREPNKEILSEEAKNKIFLIKGLIAVRSIIGKNSFLFLQIKEIFLLSFYDINVIWLQNYNSIIEYWNCIIKQKNFFFHRFVNYSSFYDDFYGSISDEELKFDDRCAFGQENLFISSTSNITGIRNKYPNNGELILYLFYLFLDLNQLRLYKNKVYSKKINSRISWHAIFNFKEIKEKFISNFDKLKLKFPQQLKYFNINTFFFHDLDLTFEVIKKNNILVHEESFFDLVIEFKDGVFFFTDKKFLEFSCIDNLYKLNTNIYIDCFYFEMNSSSFWLPLLKEKLSNSEFESLFFKNNDN